MGGLAPYNERMETQAEYNRLVWHSRRGMLELDLVLEPFVKEVYPGLDETDKARYRKLLLCEDQDLFGFFLGRVTPQDEELAAIVKTILAYTRAAD